MNIIPINRIINDESGATAIEYGLIAGLVTVVAISSMSAVGDALTEVFTTSAAAIKAAGAAGGAGGAGGV